MTMVVPEWSAVSNNNDDGTDVHHIHFNGTDVHCFQNDDTDVHHHHLVDTEVFNFIKISEKTS